MITMGFFYLAGLGVGLLAPADSLSKAFGVVAAVTITAFVASFKTAFAALSESEKWQKLVLIYAPVMLFGIYSPVVWHEAGAPGIVVLLCAGLIHLASWANSSDSRKYRLEQFVLGYASQMPATAKLIATLNARGLSGEADGILQALFKDVPADLTGITERLTINEMSLFNGVPEELSRHCGISQSE